MKTIQYLNDINKKYDLSDYKVSELLEITRSSVSKYRTRKATFDDETAIKVAELLGLNPAIVMADIHAERAKIRKTKKIWQDIAKALRTTAAAFLMTAIIALASTNTPFDSVVYADAPQDNLYYVKLSLLLLIGILWRSLSAPANIRSQKLCRI